MGEIFRDYPNPKRPIDFVIKRKDDILAIGLARYDSDRGGAQEDDRTGGYNNCAGEFLQYAQILNFKTKLIFINDGPGLLLGSMWDDYSKLEMSWSGKIMVSTLRMIPERLTLDWLNSYKLINMATGGTKNNWQNLTNIVSDHTNNNIDSSYSLTYLDKIPEKEILAQKCKTDFNIIFNNERPSNNSFANALFYGDNIEVLRHLIKDLNLRNSVTLIYIDPPYSTNSIFHTRENKESYKGTSLIGSNFIEFLRQRLVLLRELLNENGSIYLHLDNNMVFQMKIIMDEIFGSKNCRSFIVRKKCANKNYTKKNYGNISDYILFYSKTDKFTWNRPTDEWTEEKIKKEYSNIEVLTGRKFKKVPIHAPGIRNGETGKAWKGMLPPIGKHWQYTPDKLDALDKAGEIYWSPTGNPRRKVYFDKSEGIPIQDIWLDYQDSLNQNIKITGYPTEKNSKLLDLIIKASSNEGDVVLDCFVGSGTTLESANNLKRKWIGIDNSSEAMDHIFKRFVEGTKAMGDFVERKNETKNLSLFDFPKDVYQIQNNFEFKFFSDSDHQNISKSMIEKWYKKLNISSLSE